MKHWITILLLSGAVFSAAAQNRGGWFAKKQYDNQPLPTYAENRDRLPEPVCEEHPEWIDLYWRTWEIAFSRLRSPEAGAPFVSNWIDEALSPQIYQWDTHFMAMFGRYAHHIFPFIASQDNFYASQHADGMICRVINENDGSDHWWGMGVDNARAINPPLFSWAEVQTYMATADKSRFALVLEPLEHYVEWIERNRCGGDTPHRLYWSNGQASGMDNTPRDLGRPEPGDGWNCHSAIDHMGWEDLSSQMVMCYNELAYICRELGHKAKAEKYARKAKEIARRINAWMWDDTAGLYRDVTPAGEKTSWITIATFWPLLAGIASEEQGARLVENLKDPGLFWSRNPVPSLALNQPEYDRMGCYWRGGVWAPTNYMVVEGLKRYGYDDLAEEIARRYLEMLTRVYAKTRTLWEVYSPEIDSPATNASGIHLVEPEFVGWTGLGPISMLIETILGIEVDAPAQTIRWRINGPGRQGIRNLTFAGGRVDLVATPTSEGYEAVMKSDRPVKIILSTERGDTTIHLEPAREIRTTIP